MKPTALRVLCTVLLAAAVQVAVAGATYKWVDAQGVVHYSDTPQPGAQQISLPAAQTYHSTAAPAAPVGPVGSRPNAPAVGYQSCAIVAPGAEQTLTSPTSVHVSVVLNPNLQSGDTLSVTMDGAALNSGNGSGQDFDVTDLERGAHTISAAVLSATGQTLCSAAQVTFYVLRPSLANPQASTHPH